MITIYKSRWSTLTRRKRKKKGRKEIFLDQGTTGATRYSRVAITGAKTSDEELHSTGYLSAGRVQLRASD